MVDRLLKLLKLFSSKFEGLRKLVIIFRYWESIEGVKKVARQGARIFCRVERGGRGSWCIVFLNGGVYQI